MSHRIAIAGLHMECATFLPHVTDLATFEANTVREQAMIDRYAGSNTVVGGFLAVLGDADATPVPLIHADGGAAGSADGAAVATLRAEIVERLTALAGQIDGVLLHLHGALATTDGDGDPDATILDAVRAAVGPDLPVMVAMDYHGNLDAGSIAGATAIFGYRRSPHTDMGETGERAAHCLLETLAGRCNPVMAIRRPNVMLPSIFSATDLKPLADILRAAKHPEGAEGRFVDVSVFAGFAYADVPNCGMSVVAVTDGDPDQAAGLADALSEEISNRRHALYAPTTVHSLEDGVARALDRARNATRPVVLLEHADRANDSTHGLRALLAKRARVRIAVPYLWDPVAASTALAAGEGATIRVALGGHSAPKAGGPVTVDARVVAVRPDFRYRGTGPMRVGAEIRLGDTALLDVDGISISVTSLAHSAIDFDPFRQFGLDPADFDIVLLRSKTHFRAVWDGYAADILIVDTDDYGPADLTRLPYSRAPIAASYPFYDPV